MMLCPWALRLPGEIDSRSDPPDSEAAMTNYLRALAEADELGMRPVVARRHLSLGALYYKTGIERRLRGISRRRCTCSARWG